MTCTNARKATDGCNASAAGLADRHLTRWRGATHPHVIRQPPSLLALPHTAAASATTRPAPDGVCTLPLTRRLPPAHRRLPRATPRVHPASLAVAPTPRARCRSQRTCSAASCRSRSTSSTWTGSRAPSWTTTRRSRGARAPAVGWPSHSRSAARPCAAPAASASASAAAMSITRRAPASRRRTGGCEISWLGPRAGLRAVREVLSRGRASTSGRKAVSAAPRTCRCPSERARG